MNYKQQLIKLLEGLSFPSKRVLAKNRRIKKMLSKYSQERLGQQILNKHQDKKNIPTSTKRDLVRAATRAQVYADKAK